MISAEEQAVDERLVDGLARSVLEVLVLLPPNDDDDKNDDSVDQQHQNQQQKYPKQHHAKETMFRLSAAAVREIARRRPPNNCHSRSSSSENEQLVQRAMTRAMEMWEISRAKQEAEARQQQQQGKRQQTTPTATTIVSPTSFSLFAQPAFSSQSVWPPMSSSLLLSASSNNTTPWQDIQDQCGGHVADTLDALLRLEDFMDDIIRPGDDGDWDAIQVFLQSTGKNINMAELEETNDTAPGIDKEKENHSSPSASVLLFQKWTRLHRQWFFLTLSDPSYSTNPDCWSIQTDLTRNLMLMVVHDEALPTTTIRQQQQQQQQLRVCLHTLLDIFADWVNHRTKNDLNFLGFFLWDYIAGPSDTAATAAVEELRRHDPRAIWAARWMGSQSVDQVLTLVTTPRKPENIPNAFDKAGTTVAGEDPNPSDVNNNNSAVFPLQRLFQLAIQSLAVTSRESAPFRSEHHPTSSADPANVASDDQINQAVWALSLIRSVLVSTRAIRFPWYLLHFPDDGQILSNIHIPAADLAILPPHCVSNNTAYQLFQLYLRLVDLATFHCNVEDDELLSFIHDFCFDAVTILLCGCSHLSLHLPKPAHAISSEHDVDEYLCGESATPILCQWMVRAVESWQNSWTTETHSKHRDILLQRAANTLVQHEQLHNQSI